MVLPACGLLGHSLAYQARLACFSILWPLHVLKWLPGRGQASPTLVPLIVIHT